MRHVECQRKTGLVRTIGCCEPEDIEWSLVFGSARLKGKGYIVTQVQHDCVVGLNRNFFILNFTIAQVKPDLSRSHIVMLDNVPHTLHGGEELHIGWISRALPVLLIRAGSFHPVLVTWRVVLVAPTADQCQNRSEE